MEIDIAESITVGIESQLPVPRGFHDNGVIL